MTSAFFVLLLLLTATLAGWTRPMKLMDFAQGGYVISSYRDPATSLTHVLSGRENGGYFYYLAVDEEGTVVYQQNFYALRAEYPAAVICGADDGKRLFQAQNYYTTDPPINSVVFRNSTDGGKTWSKGESIADSYGNLYLIDLVYVKETGWLFLFSETYWGTLKVSSKAPGASEFSDEKTICDMASKPMYPAKAGYSLRAGKPVLHVVYMRNSNGELSYTNSADNSQSWAASKKINVAGASATAVLEVIHDSRAAHFVYLSASNKAATMISTTDFGMTFTGPSAVTLTATELGGLAICEGGKAMVSLFAGKDGMEYAVWGLGTKVTKRKYPVTVEMKKVMTARVECAQDGAGLKVSTFVVAQDANEKRRLYFAMETGIPLM